MLPPKAISLLLAALVVLCPFQCAFGSCLASGSGGQNVSMTSCCDHCPQSSSESEHDSMPPGECGCHDCFCCGALPATEVLNDFELARLVDFTFVVLELPQTPAKLLSAQRDRWPSARSVVATALEFRADLCCWLI